MFAAKTVRHHTLIYTCGTVIDNILNDGRLNSYLQIRTEQNSYIMVLYNSEFPPSQNIDAGDMAFGLEVGDEVEMMAEIVSDNLLSICANERCGIAKLRSSHNN